VDQGKDGAMNYLQKGWNGLCPAAADDDDFRSIDIIVIWFVRSVLPLATNFPIVNCPVIIST
jgi:hypothetical protein